MLGGRNHHKPLWLGLAALALVFIVACAERGRFATTPAGTSGLAENPANHAGAYSAVGQKDVAPVAPLPANIAADVAKWSNEKVSFTEPDGKHASTRFQAVRGDTSPPLADIKPSSSAARRYEEREHDTFAIPNTRGPISDPVVQDWFGALAMPDPIQNFEGIPNVAGVIPPDTNGDVGPNHYVQMVNNHIQIFTKTGTSMYGPVPISTLWSGHGGICESEDRGDPIVLYDSMADRWLVSQFAFGQSQTPSYECIAVSASADPMGAYYRYTWLLSNDYFHDYPHFGVWPDGYYMGTVVFASQAVGFSIFVFNRDEMLSGDSNPSAWVVNLGISQGGGVLLPADLDGPPPPAGSPNFVATVPVWADIANTVRLFKFSVDWGDPGNFTYTGPYDLTTAPYDSSLCNYDRDCIPQAGTSQRLDALGSERPMHRIAYRNFGTHESLTFNHTVDVGGDHAGVRWYEVRNLNGSPSIHQQGSYAPDANHRWTGSVAMDRDGNLAVGYSVSGNIYPAIRYAGRLATDPPGVLAQGEASLIEGGGAQLPEGGQSHNRWGDYSSLSVDPTDDCTFWYTTEYYQTSHPWDWNTRIGSFKFPSCASSARCPGERFNDVCPEDYFYQAVIYLNDNGVISGYADGSFRPFNNTTRAQLSKIIVLAEGWPIDTSGGPHFSDVPTSYAFYNYIETAYNNEIIVGYTDGTFRPGNNVTRGQLCKIIVLAEEWTDECPTTGHFSDVPPSNPFFCFIETAYAHSIISGYADGMFRPGNSATRGQICKIVHSAITEP